MDLLPTAATSRKGKGGLSLKYYERTMIMSYLNEIIAFDRLAEIERISPKEQALWRALMSIANSLGWPETFSVANLTLQSKAVLSERDVTEARNRLAQRGLIEYKTRGGSKAPIYSIVKITDNPADNPADKTGDKPPTKSPDNPATNYGGNPADNPATLNRLEKIRQDKNNPPNPPRGYDALFDRFWSAYPKKVAKDTAKKAFAKHKPDEAMTGVMLAALEKHKRTDQWTRDGGQFIPNPATWLNQKRWEDELPKPFIGKKTVFQAYDQEQSEQDSVSVDLLAEARAMFQEKQEATP